MHDRPTPPEAGRSRRKPALRAAAVAAVLLTCLTSRAAAGNVTTIVTYPSSVSSDAGGPLDLRAELNYDDARTDAPIFVVMHGFSPTLGNFDNVRAGAQRLRDRGFFAVSVAMRGRDGSDGVRDSGGVEIHDIYDAVEFVKATYAPYVDASSVSITGYSGGGGNVMSALVRFPDTFRVGAGFFGMSDYGHDPVHGWYFQGAGSGHRAILVADVGDPTSGNPQVADRYHARASNLAAANNLHSEVHLFVNHDELTCPPLNDFRYRDLTLGGLARAETAVPVAGTVWNVTVHIGGLGEWVDFNHNGIPDPGEWQDWPHQFPTAGQQAAAEGWYLDRLLRGKILQPVLDDEGTLVVLGYVRTRPFSLWMGDGQDAVARLAYDLSPQLKRFDLEMLTLDKAATGELCVDTADMDGKTVLVRLNGVTLSTFVGGGIWCRSGLADGDVLELIGP
jgi:dienelactone hydrolase